MKEKILPYVFQLKKMATNVTKTLEVFFFFWRSYQEKVLMIFVGKHL